MLILSLLSVSKWAQEKHPLRPAGTAVSGRLPVLRSAWVPVSCGPRRTGAVRHRAGGAAGPCRAAKVCARERPGQALEQPLFHPSKMSVRVKEEGCVFVHTPCKSCVEEPGSYRTQLLERL